MTVWILLTLALGAMTGTAERPLLRTHCANSVSQSRAETEQRVSRSAARESGRIRCDRRAMQTAARDPFRIEVPLTGAAAPRAPAPNC